MTNVQLRDDELLIPDMTDDEFPEFGVQDRDLRIERSADGRVIVLPATCGETGTQNSEITFQLMGWAKRDGRGVTFDSSTGFRPPSADPFVEVDGALGGPGAKIGGFVIDP